MATLETWLKKQGRGSLTKLHHDTQLPYATLKRARNGICVARYVGPRIFKATGGEVPENDAYRNNGRR